jgi:hypothetical protein
MKKQRKPYTPEEKVSILRRHLVEGVRLVLARKKPYKTASRRLKAFQ